MRMMTDTLGFALALGMSLLVGAAAAAYPEKPIRMIVPYAPGGSTDIAARIVADGLSKNLGVPVVIQNQPGASGNVGAATVARSAADGYTLLFTGSGIASVPSTKDVQFDLRKDLQPVSRVVSSQFSILVNPKLPVNNLQEFLAYARARPGKLDMACSGALTAAHFALEGFRQAAGLDFVTIQFNGNAPAATAMMSGEPPAGIDAAFSAKGAVTSGRLRAIAVTGSQRSPLLPGVPTASEAGVPGYQASFSLVMMAPGAVPKDIVDRLHQSIVVTLKDSAIMQKLEAQGFEIIGNSPAEYRAELEGDIKQNAGIIASLRKAGVID